MTMQPFIEHGLAALLKTSGQVAALVLLILVAQWALGRRLPPRWRHALWLLVIARLIIPWSIPVPIPHLETPASRIGGVVAAAPGGTVHAAADTVMASPRRIPWLAILWAAGAISLAAYLAAAHWRLARKIAAARPMIDAPLLNLLEDCKERMGVRTPISIIQTAEVGSPSLFGFVRPRLLLPKGLARHFSREEMRFVFLHELAHVKRNDIALSWLTTVLQIAHWFNPLVWLAFRRMRVDRELACDDTALRFAGEGENRDYGAAILKLLENFGRSAWAPSLAGALEDINHLKERMRMIAKFKAKSPAPVAALSLFVALGLVTFTGAQTPEPTKPDSSADGPPRIVATSPTNAATDVDQDATTEITVTFDKDMDRGMSWVGSGPAFPRLAEGKQFHWQDKRTCVFPVKLYGAHYYHVGLNSPAYHNFQSEAGVPAAPSALSFTTKGATAATKMKLRTPAVVEIKPANGARDVDPKLAELRVTFNVPMGGDFSWCGDPSKQPQTPEGKRPYWTDDHKTCVLPVSMQPGSHYEFWLNSQSFHGFKSEAGVPLESVAYSFDTSK